ncbi:DUF5692 family protein [Adlercreutzia aquisgranensis]|uniref:DUF5692 family protein n=1 Tax=Adlercreutzia aquisgranensis TaxID=2941323 RepID=UPI00203FB4CA|nr:DUF5692 family protein [Adlercreutzia aquisgranensis]
MLFDVYGPNALYQWLGLAMVLVALILLNEFARRTKAGGMIMFFGVAGVMTVYCIAIAVGAGMGAEWALTNPTHTDMNSWFHYAKVYAALAGCIGFMALKYSWGKIGRSHWFKAFPFVIVAINILIAVVSDFESAFRAFGTTWVSSEGVTLYGGWHNVFNGIAGILNILCMTGWFGIYISKKRQDMIWADMTWVFIIAYDLWNFCYTYNCLPTHSWYCGIALLLAPTIAGLLWNKGGWIQNRAFTLAMWCMFCQMVPMFANDSIFAANSVNNPNVNLAVSLVALVANIAALAYIVYRSKKLGVNPYKQEVFVGTKDFKEAMARRADTAYLLETEPKSATPAEIAEMVAYNAIPVEGTVGYVYVAKDAEGTVVEVETNKRE